MNLRLLSNEQQASLWIGWFVIGYAMIYILTWVGLELYASLGDKEISFPQEYSQHTEWIIKWEEGHPPPEADGFDVVNQDYSRQLLLAEVHEDVNIEEWYQEWMSRDHIEYVRPNSTLTIESRHGLDGIDAPDSGVSTTDPREYWGGEYERADAEYQQLIEEGRHHFRQTNVEEGWKIARKNDDITIAIVDTGVDLTHPDLAEHVVEGYNLLDDRPPQDDNGHGTQVAGILAALGHNNPDVRGVLWSTNIMPVKVLDEEGIGTDFDVSQGIYYAVDEGADIIVLSLADPIFSMNMKEAVEYAEENGALVISATGNAGGEVHYPAAFPTVLAVGAVSPFDGPRADSNFGPEVGVVAPDRILTTSLHGEYVIQEGTSMAVPQVAGLAALILERYPDLTPSEVRNHIIYTTEEVLFEEEWNQYTGHGRIDFAQSLQTEPVRDIHHPNHSQELASPFPIETMVRSELSNQEDIDWFMIDTPYAGTIELDVWLEVGRYEGIELTFYPDQEQEEDAEGEDSEPETYIIQKSELLEIEVPQGITYIRLQYHPEERRTYPVQYELINSFIIYADDQQPNDNEDEATELSGNSEVIVGTFHRDGITDWYYFDAPESGQIDLHITVDSQRLDPQIYYEAPNGTTRFIDNGNVNNGQEERLITQVEEGRHLFSVNHAFSDKVVGEYYLILEFTPEAELPSPDPSLDEWDEAA